MVEIERAHWLPPSYVIIALTPFGAAAGHEDMLQSVKGGDNPDHLTIGPSDQWTHGP